MSTSETATQQVPGLTRTDLQQHDLSAPGREVVQNRVDITPGVAADQAQASGRGDHLRPRRIARVSGSTARSRRRSRQERSSSSRPRRSTRSGTSAAAARPSSRRTSSRRASSHVIMVSKARAVADVIMAAAAAVDRPTVGASGAK